MHIHALARTTRSPLLIPSGANDAGSTPTGRPCFSSAATRNALHHRTIDTGSLPLRLIQESMQFGYVSERACQ